MPGFNPDQPRDEKGQWTAGGAGDAIKNAAAFKFNTELMHGLEMAGPKPPKVATNEDEAYKAIEEFRDNGLTKEMERAVQDYTNGAYYDLNKWLRGGQTSPDSDTAIFKPYKADEIITGLEKFIDAAPKYNGEVYRGIRFGSNKMFDDFKNNLVPGSVVEDHGFVSSTTELNNVNVFSVSRDDPYAVNMVIKSKTGVFVDPISSFKGEKEVMFKRRSRFKVNNVNEKPYKHPAYGDVSGKLLTVEMEEL